MELFIAVCAVSCPQMKRKKIFQIIDNFKEQEQAHE